MKDAKCLRAERNEVTINGVWCKGVEGMKEESQHLNNQREREDIPY